MIGLSPKNDDVHEGPEEKRFNSLTTHSLWSFKDTKSTKRSMPPAASFPAFAGTSLKSWVNRLGLYSRPMPEFGSEYVGVMFINFLENMMGFNEAYGSCLAVQDHGVGHGALCMVFHSFEKGTA